jgi:hypothetical protein
MGNDVTDKGMEMFGRLSNLEEVTIWRGEITDAGLAHLKECANLKKLWLEECKWFTDAGLAVVENFPLLEELQLSNGQFSAEGLTHLRPLVALRYVNFPGMMIADAELDILGSLPKLEMLFLDGDEITDAGVRHLGNLSQLKYLSLRSSAITDSGLEPLKRLSRLKHLTLSGSAGISEAAIRELRSAIPQCAVSYSPSRADRMVGTRQAIATGVRHAPPQPSPPVSLAPMADGFTKDTLGATDKPLPRVERPQPRPDSPAARLDRARRELSAFGVTLSMDEDNPEPTGFVLSGQRLTPDIVARLEQFESLVEAQLQDSVSTDEDLPLLLRLPRIRAVRLNGSQFTRAACRRLRSCRNCAKSTWLARP